MLDAPNMSLSHLVAATGIGTNRIPHVATVLAPTAALFSTFTLVWLSTMINDARPAIIEIYDSIGVLLKPFVSCHSYKCLNPSTRQVWLHLNHDKSAFQFVLTSRLRWALIWETQKCLSQNRPIWVICQSK